MTRLDRADRRIPPTGAQQPIHCELIQIAFADTRRAGWLPEASSFWLYPTEPVEDAE